MVFTPNPNSIISGRDHSGQAGGGGTSDAWKDVLRRGEGSQPNSTIPCLSLKPSVKTGCQT